MTQSSTISERLLAHARLCREIASATLNEETASALERLAVDCIRAAGMTDAAAPRPAIIPNSFGSRRATA